MVGSGRLARCWVLREWLSAAVSGDSTVDEPFCSLLARPGRCVGGAGVGLSWGASCFLRTAQWTRASLSLLVVV